MNFSDLTGAGSRRGSRRDPCQSLELRHNLPGEREDHRAGVQEPAVLPETHGGERRLGLDKNFFHNLMHFLEFLHYARVEFHRKSICLIAVCL